jgi:hypothetical protein
MRPRPVSKKRPAGEPSKPSDPITVKLNRELMRKAEAVASFRGVSRQDYLEALMRPLIEADYRAFLREESSRDPSP